MSEPSEEDIQALQDYADRMKAMGDSVGQPDSNDVSGLQDYASRTQAMGDSANGFTRENPYGSDAAPAVAAAPSTTNTQAGNSRGSKLIDLPHGGAVVQDPDGYAALVQRPSAERSSYGNTLNTTSRGRAASEKSSDVEDYKKYLAMTGDNRAKMMAASGYQLGVNEGKPGKVLLAAGVGGVGDEMQNELRDVRRDYSSARTTEDKVEKPPITKNETSFKMAVDALKQRLPSTFAKDLEKSDWYQEGLSKAQDQDVAASRQQLANQARMLSGGGFLLDRQTGGGMKQLEDLPEDLSDLKQQKPAQGNELGAPDPYAALRKTQVSSNYVDPVQAQVQAEKTAPVSAEDEAANKAWIQQQNNPPPPDPDERDKYRGEGTGTKSAPDETYPAMGPENPNQIDPQTGQPVVQPEPQRPVYSPGGWGRTISPATQGMIENAFGAPRQEQLAAQYMNMHHFNEVAQAEAAKRSGEAQAEMQRQQAERDRSQRIVQRQRDDLDAANKAYNNAKIDPDRFFKNRDAASNVMSAIGVALGAFGASLTHSPNFALEIVNKAVDNDIEAQKAEQAKLGNRASNQLSQLKDATGSQEAAEGAYRLASLQYAQAKAGELDTQGKGAALQKMFGDEIAKEQKFLAMYRANTEKYIAPQLIGGGADTGIDDKERGRVFQLPYDMSGYEGGTTFIANNEKDAEALKTATEGYSILHGLRDKVSALEKKYGKGLLYGEGRNAYDALVTNAVSQAGHVNAVAKQPVVDTALLHEQLKLPDSWADMAMNAAGFGPTATQRWDNALDSYGVSHRSILQTRAVEKANPFYGKTPSGRLIPKDEITGDRAAPQGMPQGFKRVTGASTALPNRVLPQKKDVRNIPEPTKGKGGGRGRGNPPPSVERESDEEAGED